MCSPCVCTCRAAVTVLCIEIVTYVLTLCAACWQYLVLSEHLSGGRCYLAICMSPIAWHRGREEQLVLTWAPLRRPALVLHAP